MHSRIEQSCRLCGGKLVEFHRGRRREYLRCRDCKLVNVAHANLPTIDQERAVYDLHENAPDDAGYRRFLGRLFDPLNLRLPPASHGLDFGAGPGPTLSVMFEEAGHRVAIYDPIYAPDRSSLQHTYDFVTATEVVEHLHYPRQTLDLMWSLLRPGGWLGIMTKRVDDSRSFANWHYISDPTHVGFYSLATFQWLARGWPAELHVLGADVVLLRKPDAK